MEPSELVGMLKRTNESDATDFDNVDDVKNEL